MRLMSGGVIGLIFGVAVGLIIGSIVQTPQALGLGILLTSGITVTLGALYDQTQVKKHQ